MRGIGRELFEKGKVDGVSGNRLDAAQPYGGAVREFVELPGLGPEDPSEMMGRFAMERGALGFEVVDEEAAAHEFCSGQFTVFRRRKKRKK